ncbi:MAG: hypothetical protein U0324_33955 [Polyangiales bacterium]
MPLLPHLSAPSDAPALLADGRPVSFRALAWHVQRFVASLDTLRVPAGEPVALLAQPQLAAAVAALGLVGAERPCLVLDPRLDAVAFDRARALAGATHAFAPRPAALPLAGVHRVVLDEPRRLERMQRLELPGDRVDDAPALLFLDVGGAPAVVTRRALAGDAAAPWPTGDLPSAFASLFRALREGRALTVAAGDVLTFDGAL